MKNLKIEKNEKAMSPVIGVIIMVAATIFLAAVIAWLVVEFVPSNEYKSDPEGISLKLTDHPQTNITSMGNYRYQLEGDEYYKAINILSKKCHVIFLSQELKNATIELRACDSYPFN